MCHSIDEKNRTHALKYRTPITLLAIAALFFVLLDAVSYFAYYYYENVGSGIPCVLVFDFPSLLSWVSLILKLLPFLLLLFATGLFHSRKAPILVALVFASVALGPIYEAVRTIFIRFSVPEVVPFLVNMITVALFTLATVSILKGMPNKLFIVLAPAVGLALALISLIALPDLVGHYITRGWHFYLLTAPAGILASILLNLALLLFGLKNRVHTVPETVDIDPELKLLLLQEKLERGDITEEEYRAMRADIIHNF